MIKVHENENEDIRVIYRYGDDYDFAELSGKWRTNNMNDIIEFEMYTARIKLIYPQKDDSILAFIQKVWYDFIYKESDFEWIFESKWIPDRLFIIEEKPKYIVNKC